jgi:hypothetical protein
VEGLRQEPLSRGEGSPGLAGRIVAGALAGAFAEVLAWALAWALARTVSGDELFRRFAHHLAAWWIAFPAWGAALGAWLVVRERSRGRGGLVALAAVLTIAPFLYHPVMSPDAPWREPSTPEAKTRAIRRWSLSSPAQVARIVPLSRDPDPVIRQQAVQALGINLVVKGLDVAPLGRPLRFQSAALRDSLRGRLLEALAGDPLEGVRVEAAHALWSHPRVFGRAAAAAETLAAALDRARPLSERPDRTTYLALDAMAGEPDSILRAAARRFAAREPEPTTRGAVLRAAAGEPAARLLPSR